MHITTIGITLFEEQLIRSYLLSDNLNLLRVIGNHKKIVIFTRIDLLHKVKSLSHTLPSIDIEVVSFIEYGESRIQKILSFFASWTDPSIAVIRKLKREYISNRIGSLGYYFRICIWHLFSSNNMIKSFIRFLYLHLSTKNRIRNSFSTLPPKLDLLFVTSLTNKENDLPVAIFYRKSQISVIATVRSWDNLVTKGILQFVPNLFISHSETMSHLAIKSHGFKAKIIKTWVTPCYQSKYKVDSTRSLTKTRKITYACMGPHLNPDEINFIVWLKYIAEANDFKLTILQHPKFQHDSLNLQLKNHQILCFNYMDSTLQEYYEFLSHQDLVILSGTSVALDALFVGTKILALGFEIQTQNFWLSHLRSFDYLPHSVWLFENLPIVKVTNKLDLISNIFAVEHLFNIDEYFSVLQQIIGNTNLNFINLLDEWISLNLEIEQ